MRSSIVFDGEVDEIRVKTQKKISRFVGKLFPDRRLIREPMKMLRRKHGDVFEAMRMLEEGNCFATLRGKELLEKYKIALEVVLHMQHYRVETHIIAYPQSWHLAWAKRLVGPWYELELKDLNEVRSQIIAMQAEGFPRD